MLEGGCATLSATNNYPCTKSGGHMKSSQGNHLSKFQIQRLRLSLLS